MKRRAPAVFLDRDGTLCVEGEWVTRGQDLVLVPGAARAVARLNAAGVAVVLVTNQSAIARGLLDEDGLAAIHEELGKRLAAEGARLDAIYFCPHHPTEGQGAYRVDCTCRKPKPGLIERAAREMDLDLARSYVIGDAERDLAAGAALGVPGILVATGKGVREYSRLLAKGKEPADFVPDLESASRRVLARLQGR